MEKSCGAVVFTRQAGEIRYLIIRQRNGVCGFPKGHVELGETEEETALREIREEVGLEPALVSGFRTVDEYPLPNRPGVLKQVVYFLAEDSGREVTLQEEELTGAGRMTFEEALEQLNFDSARRVLRQAHAFLSK